MAVKEKNIEKKSRIIEYLKEEHKWESYAIILFSLIVLLLGALILNSSLVIKNEIWLIGTYPTQFAWILIVFSAAMLIYGLFPFFKPAFPEFRKISWLTGRKFIANSIRVFMFLIIFACLFLLYDAFITQVLAKILG